MNLSRFRTIQKQAHRRSEYPTLRLAPKYNMVNQLGWEILSDYDGMTFLFDADNREVFIKLDRQYSDEMYKIPRSGRNLSVPNEIRYAFGIDEHAKKPRVFRLTLVKDPVVGLTFSESDELT